MWPYVRGLQVVEKKLIRAHAQQEQYALHVQFSKTRLNRSAGFYMRLHDVEIPS